MGGTKHEELCFCCLKSSIFSIDVEMIFLFAYFYLQALFIIIKFLLVPFTYILDRGLLVWDGDVGRKEYITIFMIYHVACNKFNNKT